MKIKKLIKNWDKNKRKQLKKIKKMCIGFKLSCKGCILYKSTKCTVKNLKENQQECLPEDWTFEKKKPVAIKIDWTKIPEWAQYLAMDKSDDWYGYEFKPYFSNKNAFTWFVINGSYSPILSEIIKITGKIKWKESLIKRPGITEVKNE